MVESFPAKINFLTKREEGAGEIDSEGNKATVG